jgi:FkbM family methyltransferase
MNEPRAVRRPTPAALLNEIRQMNWAVMDRDHWGSTFETASMAIYEAVLRPGETAIDCGVNIGAHSYVMARLVGVTGRVVGFEAVPAVFETTRTRLLSLEQFQPINKAVLDRPGAIKFHYNAANDGLSGIRAREGIEGFEEIEVPATTLDAEVEGHVSLIKLDIEGAEFAALRGARRILEQSAPVIVFEHGRSSASDNFDYTKEEFFSFFDELEYQVYFISGMPLVEELWDVAAEPTHPWQFFAVHRRSPRMARVMAAVSGSLLDNAAYAFAFGGAKRWP